MTFIKLFLKQNFPSLNPKAVFFIFACLLFLPGLSQKKYTEAEFQRKFITLKNDTDRINLMRKYSAENSGNSFGINYALNAVKLAEEKQLGQLMVDSYEIAGDAYWYVYNYAKAIDYYFKELKFADSLGLEKNKARAYYNIGWIKCLQQESFKDRNYLINAVKIFERLNDTADILEVYNALAGAYQNESKNNLKLIDSTLYYFRSLVFFSEKINKKYNIVIHANYASFLTQIGRYNEAKMYLLKCVEVAQANNEEEKYAHTGTYLGELYFKIDSFGKAKKILNKIIPILIKTRQLEALANVYSIRSKIFFKENNFKEAYLNRILYSEIRDSVTKSIFKSNLMEKESQYEIEKRESNIKKLEHLNEVSELKNKQNKFVIFGLMFIAALIIVFALNLFKGNRTKQKANKLLNEKNLLIEEQKKAVEEKNNDITNSINYAKRIQEAILPAKELKYKLFPTAFVLFQPKDIVSGDFYWFTEKNNKRIIAAIDCTGHGVPGAFMSMIGNTFLHEAINEKGITKPGLILNELRDNVISSLKQTEVIDSTKDGMDMALLSFDIENRTVEFAGANNPLWLIREGNFVEFKGDKKPIGYFSGKEFSFTTTKIDLFKGDTLYIFTDGYADQFGGEKGKKLKYKQLRELLISIQHMSMSDQELFLVRKFMDWKGNLEQIDDVCVIGIRV